MSSSFISKETLYAFISTGERHQMFTLRTMQKGISFTANGLPYIDYATQYHKNLGIDLAECVTKAEKFAKESGLEFRVSATAAKNDLVDITRLTRDELDHRKWEQERDLLAKEAKAQAKAEQRHNELSQIEWSIDSKCAFGKHRETKTIAEILNDDPEYICWLFDNNELPFKQLGNHFHAQLNWIYANVPRPEIKPVVSAWIADDVKEKLTGIRALCTGAFFRHINVGYNRTETVREYELTELDTGKQIIIKYSGDKWDMLENKAYSFDGKVKELAEWRSVKRTVLNFVKNVQEI